MKVAYEIGRGVGARVGYHLKMVEGEGERKFHIAGISFLFNLEIMVVHAWLEGHLSMLSREFGQQGTEQN